MVQEVVLEEPVVKQTVSFKVMAIAILNLLPLQMVQTVRNMCIHLLQRLPRVAAEAAEVEVITPTLVANTEEVEARLPVGTALTYTQPQTEQMVWAVEAVETLHTGTVMMMIVIIHHLKVAVPAAVAAWPSECT